MKAGQGDRCSLEQNLEARLVEIRQWMTQASVAEIKIVAMLKVEPLNSPGRWWFQWRCFEPTIPTHDSDVSQGFSST